MVSLLLNDDVQWREHYFGSLYFKLHFVGGWIAVQIHDVCIIYQL